MNAGGLPAVSWRREVELAARTPRVRPLRGTRETPKSNELGPAPKVRAPATVYASASGGNDVLGLRALLALRDVEVHLLAFLQLAEALGCDVRVVGEDVGAATLLLDEAETLFRVEPLHGASSHVISPSGQCPEPTPCGLRIAALIARPETNTGNTKTLRRVRQRARLKSWEPQLQLRSTVARYWRPCAAHGPDAFERVKNNYRPRGHFYSCGMRYSAPALDSIRPEMRRPPRPPPRLRRHGPGTICA